MTHHTDSPPDIFDINGVVQNEENKSWKKTTNNNSNGSGPKIYDSSPSSKEIGLKFEEEVKLILEN